MNNPSQKSKRLFVAAVVIAFAALSASSALAQGDRISVPLSDPARPAMVKVSLLNGSITVKGYDGKEVVVEAHSRAGRESSRSEGGMRRVPLAATGLSVEEENNEVRVGVEAINRTIDLEISVPRRSSLYLRSVNNGNIVVSDVDGEMDVNNINGRVTLTNIGGSAVVDALNGRIEVSFNRVDSQKAMSFSSMNGNIDVTFPADLKANVSFRTDNGEVFSDFDVQVQATASKPITEGDTGKGKYRVKIDRTTNATINGGGQTIQFKNFNGNIYIRKPGGAK